MPAPLQALLLRAVNNVLGSHTSRMAVIYDRLPGGVLALLLLIAAVSIALAAYSAGLRGNVCRWRMGAFAVIRAALMLLILDSDIILRGLIRVNHESLSWLIQEMEAALPH